MKNNKLFIGLVCLALNSSIKSMDFNGPLFNNEMEKQEEELTSSMTFAERVAYAAAVATTYREKSQEETKTASEDSSVDENSSTCKRQKTSYSSTDKVMDFYEFLEDNDDTNKVDFDFIDSEINPYPYELSQKKTQDELYASTKELRQKDSVSHNSTSLTKKAPQRKNKNKKYECDYADCNKSFTDKSNLRRHIDSVHKGKRYKCDYDDCDKSFATAGNLKKHINSAHEGKRYTCTYDDCDKSFTEVSSLKKHRESAHEGKKYLCTHDGCNKSFTQQQNLIKHIKSIHESVRYSCSECNKTFSTKGNLKTHFDKQHG